MTDQAEKFADGVFAAVKGYMVKAMADLSARLDALEKRQPEKGLDGRDGKDGKDGKDGLDGKDGQSVDPQLIEATIKAAVAAIPTPKDGRDGINGKDGLNGKDGINGKAGIDGKNGVDGKDGKDAVLDLDFIRMTIREEVRQAVDALPKPEAGKDGKDASPEMVELAVRRAVESLPKPKDGEKGEDGKDADPDFIRAEIRKAVAELDITAEVQKAVASIPKPRDGIDGKSVSVEDVRGVIEAEVERRVAQIPVPKDGEKPSEAELAPLIRVAVARAVSMLPPAQPGRDGRDADPEMVKAAAAEALSMMPKPEADPMLIRAEVERAVKALPPAPPGRDGVSIEDVSAEFDGERRVTMKVSGGSVSKEFTWDFPNVIDRDVYKAGRYKKFDGVTYGGSYWIAKCDTDEPPKGPSNHWRLAVKRGKDAA